MAAPHVLVAGPQSVPAVTGWTNEDNVRLVDGQVATGSALFGGGVVLEAYQYGFSLPEDALIVGVALRVLAAVADAVTLTGQLCVTATPAGDELSCSVSGAVLTWYTLGGPTQLWGLELTRAVVIDDLFGAAAWFTSAEFPVAVSIDAVQLCIYYTSESQDLAEAELLKCLGSLMGGRRRRSL